MINFIFLLSNDSNRFDELYEKKSKFLKNLD